MSVVSGWKIWRNKMKISDIILTIWTVSQSEWAHWPLAAQLQSKHFSTGWCCQCDENADPPPDLPVHRESVNKDIIIKIIPNLCFCYLISLLFRVKDLLQTNSIWSKSMTQFCKNDPVPQNLLQLSGSRKFLAQASLNPPENRRKNISHNKWN